MKYKNKELLAPTVMTANFLFR